ncbi:hypothetical protein D0B54_14965 [Solimonas sp. K1W22B-7]|uniref:MraY family glycosyltransferase n=1 Tax=Solimonas sp. K1W22B-7 TaxID=2303331 RepID=UPI000E334484|nr:glycosyltransferase family 4 protein [Solimonas sp. K1W22B-7]AXQ29898.1 hypothetical protein D0B54_14965 [Solimonas sp. K1W22B-7]
MTLTILLPSAFVLSWALCAWLASPRSPLKLLDVPNERSLHKTPTARTGGVGILLTLLAGWAALALQGPEPLPGWPWFVAGYLAVAAISLADDYRQLGPRIRFGIHLAASLVPCFTGLWLSELRLPGFTIALPAWLGMPVTVLFCAWMINLYNFMDGMDGFAGGMTLIGFGTLALLAVGMPPALGLSLQATLVAGAALGFLMINFPPARLFMGDVGSAALGFAAAFFALWADRSGVLPLWGSVLLFSPFIVDATVTLLRRALNGEKLSQAHRTHHYQRLVGLGWSHRRTVLTEYLLMLAAALSAWAGSRMLPAAAAWGLIGAWLGFYAAIFIVVRSMERRKTGAAV